MKKLILSIITIAAFSLGANAQNVNIPDANFKTYLVGNSAINTNSDTEIQVSEANTFNGTINCQNLNISDLTGIEAFTSLTSLLCGNNPLGTIDVSQNSALITFQPHNNNLNSLDVSQNMALGNLVCIDNNLTSLDLSQNTNLSLLSCGNNNLTSLDVSQNTGLAIFHCADNNLSYLNMKNLDASTLTNFGATLNPNLTCIEVDDVADATANWTDIDATASFSLNCQPVLVSSISVQGQGGATTITTNLGTLQMEAVVLPANADDDTYTWSFSNGTGSASIDASGLLTAITNGTVTVIATANDASGVTGTEVITISNQDLSVGEQAAIENISIYPNPATAQLSINSDLKIERIEIMNVMGKTVKTIVNPSNTVDVSELTVGVYFLQVQTDKNVVSKKFIKE
jgi:hypothetical protein